MEEIKKPHFVQRNADLLHNDEYRQWITNVKQRFRSSQAKAAVRVNSAMLNFYWSVGRDIVHLQAKYGWGSGVIEQMSLDLREEFPNVTGFSTINLKYMRKWYVFYHDEAIKVYQAGKQMPVGIVYLVGKQMEMPEQFALVPWKHHVAIAYNCDSLDEAIFYVKEVIDGNWTRKTLEHNLKTGLYKSRGKAITNFEKRLPHKDQPQAQQMLKDPYHFDFLTLADEYDERELEDALVHNITHFLLELGQGFAFVGRQMELRMPDGQSYFPDMVFYHYRQKRFVVVELKVVNFKPEFAGKLNFYVKAADELLRGEGDNKSVGLLICKNKDKTTVEWALSDINKPLGVASYEIEQIVEQTISTKAENKIAEGNGQPV